MKTLFVVGMESEAEVVRQVFPSALIVVGAGDATLLSSRLNAALGQNAIDRVISVGICGALDPSLSVGDIVLGIMAVYQSSGIPCDRVWAERMYTALIVASPLRVKWGQFAYSPTAVARLADKAALRKATDANVVDEESFIAGSIASARKLAFAILRVVSDPALFELPVVATLKLTAAGADDIGAILASVASDPEQIPELIQLAGYSHTAMASLEAALTRIGPGFAVNPSI